MYTLTAIAGSLREGETLNSSLMMDTAWLAIESDASQSSLMWPRLPQLDPASAILSSTLPHPPWHLHFNLKTQDTDEANAHGPAVPFLGVLSSCITQTRQWLAWICRTGPADQSEGGAFGRKANSSNREPTYSAVRRCISSNDWCPRTHCRDN